MDQNPNDLIRAAEDLLEPQEGPAIEERAAIPQDLHTEAQFTEIEEPPQNKLATLPTNSAEILASESLASGNVSVYEQAPPPIQATIFQKFGDLPSHLREGEGINLVEIKKLNLAVAVEGLERASQAHENFPSPDAGFALAGLAEQVAKLTKDLEKTQDPQKILDDIMDNSIASLTREIVHDIAAEMKKFRDETGQMVRPDKRDAFDVAFKNTVNRMGPALKERLEVARTRIAKALNVKEKDRGSGQ